MGVETENAPWKHLLSGDLDVFASQFPQTAERIRKAIYASHDWSRVQGVVDLLMTDPESGEPCFVVSPLRSGPGGSMNFDVQSAPDAPKWRIDVRVTECK